LIEQGSTNTVQVIWETVLQVKRPNQQYQSTEGKNTTKVRKTQKSKQHKTQQNNKSDTHKNTKNHLLYNNTMG